MAPRNAVGQSMVSSEREQDALLAPDPERAQRMAEALHPVGELAVGPASARIDIGGLVGAAGGEIALQHVGGKIVVARDLVASRARPRARPRASLGAASRAMQVTRR